MGESNVQMSLSDMGQNGSPYVWNAKGLEPVYISRVLRPTVFLSMNICARPSKYRYVNWHRYGWCRAEKSGHLL